MVKFEYNTSFNRAVSLLSIGGYYLQGFIDDSYKKIERFPLNKKGCKVPVGYISRKGYLEFGVDDAIADASEIKNIRNIFAVKRKKKILEPQEIISSNEENLECKVQESESSSQNLGYEPVNIEPEVLVIVKDKVFP